MSLIESSVAYSTSYTSNIPAMMQEFHISSEPVATLGITTYLIGLAVGSLLLAPISETYGRKPVYIGGLILWIAMIFPAARASSMAAIIIVRFFGALGGSAMVSNSPGTITDISVPKYQALAFSIWSVGPLNGPVIGPVIGGFTTQYLGWRWTDWIVIMMGGVALALMCFIRETYTPTLLRNKAAKARKEMDDPRWWCRYDERVPFLKLMQINLSRPFIMAVKEPICIFWNIYIAIVYGILYLCFVAYPVVFTQRGFTTAQQGLSFVGIGIGTFIMIFAEPLIRKLINSHKKDPATGTVPPEAAISIVVVGAILIPVGELWFAWTCLPTSIPWAVPIAAGIPFGAGNTVVFIYATNYLAHSYGIYAASAMAGNAMIRSLLGGTLPLAGPSMYANLGSRWASCLCGLLEVLIIPIPFVFYRYGAKIREKSTLIRKMQEDRARAAKKRERAMEKNEKKALAAVDTGLANEVKLDIDLKKKMLSPLSLREIEAEKELDQIAGIDTREEWP